MWGSKIRQAIANLSPQAGNVIHLFPFRQTKQFPGSTKALLLPLNLKHSETYCYTVEIQFCIYHLDVMDKNSTYSLTTWPPKFWGKLSVSFSRISLKQMLSFTVICLKKYIQRMQALSLKQKVMNKFCQYFLQCERLFPNIYQTINQSKQKIRYLLAKKSVLS